MKEKFKIVGIIALAAIFALSFVSCDLDDDPCKDGHTFGDWQADGDLGFRACSECDETEDLTIEHFYGEWEYTPVANAGTTNPQVVRINAAAFKVFQKNAESSNFFQLASPNYVGQAYGGSAANKAKFPVGFAVSGGTRTNGTVEGGLTNETNAGVYISPDGTKIALRLTTAYTVVGGSVASKDDAREYILTKAAE